MQLFLTKTLNKSVVSEIRSWSLMWLSKQLNILEIKEKLHRAFIRWPFLTVGKLPSKQLFVVIELKLKQSFLCSRKLSKEKFEALCCITAKKGNFLISNNLWEALTNMKVVHESHSPSEVFLLYLANFVLSLFCSRRGKCFVLFFFSVSEKRQKLNWQIKTKSRTHRVVEL